MIRQLYYNVIGLCVENLHCVVVAFICNLLLETAAKNDAKDL